MNSGSEMLTGAGGTVHHKPFSVETMPENLVHVAHVELSGKQVDLAEPITQAEEQDKQNDGYDHNFCRCFFG